MGQSTSLTFGRAFRLSEAIQVIVFAAARSGVPVRLSAALRSLKAEFPEAAMSDVELAGLVTSAAADAGVTVVGPAVADSASERARPKARTEGRRHEAP
jgi:hypothetical protein